MIKRVLKQGRQPDAPSRAERKISRLVLYPKANHWQVEISRSRLELLR
jgi:hypothetical protein